MSERTRRVVACATALAVTALLVSCRKEEDSVASSIAKTERQLVERVTANPTDLEGRLSLANLYYDTDRPHRAIPAYQEVLKHRPDDPNIRTDLGTCYKRINRLDKARAEYEYVLSHNPGHLKATFNLAVVCELTADWKSAAGLWDKVVAMVPETREGKAAVKSCGTGFFLIGCDQQVQL